MFLNPDLLRKIVLITEQECSTTTSVSTLCLTEQIGDEYERDVVYYHVKYLHEANIIKIINYVGGSYCIKDLTPSGHDFAQNIHSDTIWNKTKDTAKNVGSYSIDVLKEIAIATISSAISQTKF